MNFITIQQSFVQGVGRLDAEFFQGGGYSSLETFSLGELCCFIRTGPSGATLPSSVYTDEGVPLIRPSNLDQLLCNSGELVFVSAEVIQKKGLYLYETGDIFLSRVGDVKCGLVSGFAGGVTISPNLVGVRVKKELLDPYFLLAFLQTDLARSQLARTRKHASLASLDVGAIKRLQVPVVSFSQQREIGKIMRVALEKRIGSQQLLENAELVLSSAVGVSKPTRHERFVSFSNVQKEKRLDAQYFVRGNSTETAGFISLGSIATFKRGVEVGSEEYQESGKAFWRVGNVTKYGVIGKSQKYIREELYEKLRGKYQPEVGEILLVKDGKPGVCCVVAEEMEGIVSEGIVRVRVKQFDSRYVALCISSVIGREQIRREMDGTLLPHWKVAQMNELLIPVVSEEMQEELVGLMEKSSVLRRQVEELEMQVEVELRKYVSV